MLCWEDHGPWLVPAAAVLEVVADAPTSGLPATPCWLLGLVTWRSRELPAVTPTCAAGSPSGTPRLLICVGPAGDAGVGLFAVRAGAHPRLEMVGAADLAPAARNGSADWAPWVRPVSCRGAASGALDLAALERALAGCLPARGEPG